MIKLVNRYLKNNKGFTLVELIVVIAILGVLAAIAVPKLSSFRETAARKADVATARTIATAVAALIADGEIDATDEEKTTIEDSSLVVDLLDGGTSPDPQSTSDEDAFSYEVDSDGNIKVYIDGEDDPIYPTAE